MIHVMNNHIGANSKLKGNFDYTIQYYWLKCLIVIKTGLWADSIFSLFHK